MNNTVVEFWAESPLDGRTGFHFSLTGGWDNSTFWRELTVVARDFRVTQDGTT